jgi:hypothetical protein
MEVTRRMKQFILLDVRYDRGSHTWHSSADRYRARSAERLYRHIYTGQCLCDDLQVYLEAVVSCAKRNLSKAHDTNELLRLQAYLSNKERVIDSAVERVPRQRARLPRAERPPPGPWRDAAEFELVMFMVGAVPSAEPRLMFDVARRLRNWEVFLDEVARQRSSIVQSALTDTELVALHRWTYHPACQGGDMSRFMLLHEVQRDECEIVLLDDEDVAM